MPTALLRTSLSVLLVVAVPGIGAALTDTTSAATRVAAVKRGTAPTTPKDERKQQIYVESSKIDYKGDSIVLKDVVITQGETKVQADLAQANGRLDNFDNSRWTFEGNVRINGEQHGSLKSDQAIVEFRNKSISKATITGSPAEFEQKRTDTAEMARGRAREIVYNVNDGTVRLSEDAWLSDGHNEISAPELVYNIREQHVQGTAAPGTDGRVRLRIEPKSNEEPDKKP